MKQPIIESDRIEVEKNIHDTIGWPAGTYKVEVSFNGVLNSTVEYTVQ
jgi:hypothetical protein